MLFRYKSYSQSDNHISLQDYCLDLGILNLFCTYRKLKKNCINRMNYGNHIIDLIGLKLSLADIWCILWWWWICKSHNYQGIHIGMEVKPILVDKNYIPNLNYMSNTRNDINCKFYYQNLQKIHLSRH
jgi:hypothetical protein